MSVLIDCRFADSPTGLGRYTRELTNALLHRADPGTLRILVRTAPAWLTCDADVVIADIPHYSIAEQTRLPGIITRSGASLYYAHHFNVPWRCPVPFIATVHDLILHRFPNLAPFHKRAAYAVLMHRTVRRSRRMLTVSDFVMRELATAYGSAVLEKTEKIDEGVGDVFVSRGADIVDAVRTKYGLQRPYFLYVGNAKQHKNVQTLIDAYARAGVDADLLLVTGGSEAQRLRMFNGVRRLEGVDDTDLSALYSGALAAVTASLYEGFGLPVLEALHCGCPVIASNRTAIPEAACNMAILIDPTVEEFCAAFRNPPDRRPALAHRRTWETAAQHVALLLSQVSGEITGRS